jgi:HSP20 family protein
MATTQEDVNMLEKQPETQTSPAERTRSGRVYRPNVDIVERDEELTLYADMAGASPDDIDINFENGVLTLHARVPPRHSENAQYLWREYGIGDFYRTFQVSEQIDATRISAEYKNGVLILHLPKVEQARARKIPVRTGS